MDKILHETHVSKIVLSDGIVYKTLKRKKYRKEWFDTYQIFQEHAPVVKVIDTIDDHTYSMEYLSNIDTTVEHFTRWYDDDVKGTCTKSDYIKLHKTITEAWLAAMAISDTLPEDEFFVNFDVRFKNIAVMKDRSYLYLDPDAWDFIHGYHGVDSYYQMQIKIALIMQRMIK